MRIVFKIISAPFVLALTLLVSLLYFILSVGEVFFSLAGSALAIMGIIMWAMGGTVYNSVGLLIMGFLASPFGIPAAAMWMVEKLLDLRDSLWSI